MIGDFLDSLDQRRQEANGTLRFLGSVPGDGPLEKFLGVLGAQSGQAFTDPTTGFSLGEQLLPLWEAAKHPRPGEQFGNVLLDSMGGLSMGMQPLSQMGLQAAGAVGERSYSPLFAGANMPFNLLQAHGAFPMGDQPTNLDPFSAVANKVKEVTQGYSPNMTNRDIQREVENIAIEHGLTPNGPETKMAANDPNNPLWQEAARRVAGQKGTAELGRVLGTPQVQFEAPGEQTIQRMAGDPLWQPNLKDPIEQAIFAPFTLGNENAKKFYQSILQEQKQQYQAGKLREVAGSPAIVELLAREANGRNSAIQQALQEQGLSVTGGNNPSVVDSNGQPISPELARQIFTASRQTLPDFADAGQAVRQVAEVPPVLRRGMTMAPPPADMEVLRAWDSNIPAVRAKILADPQARAIVARYKGVNP